MAPQLAWLGLGNMGRVSYVGGYRLPCADSSPGHVQEPCRERQPVASSDHL